MERGLTLPSTARPKRIACSIAARLATGSVPGSAMSTAEACVLGAAPNALGAPENILLRVSNCVCVSMPITISQTTALAPHLALRAQQLAVAAAVDQHRLEVALRAALRGAILRGHAYVAAQVAQLHAAAPGGKAQAAAERPLLQGSADRAGMPARRDFRAPLEAFQFPALHRVGERRSVASLGHLAAGIRAVAVHRREV